MSNEKAKTRQSVPTFDSINGCANLNLALDSFEGCSGLNVAARSFQGMSNLQMQAQSQSQSVATQPTTNQAQQTPVQTQSGGK